MTKEKLAILGGNPVSSTLIPIIQPTLPLLHEIQDSIEEILLTKMITNHKYVQKLEEILLNYIGVKNVIALSCCTHF